MHAPIGLICFYIGWRFHVRPSLLLASYLITAGVAAVLLERWWDRPTRRWLAARLALRRSAEPVIL